MVRLLKTPKAREKARGLSNLHRSNRILGLVESARRKVPSASPAIDWSTGTSVGARKHKAIGGFSEVGGRRAAGHTPQRTRALQFRLEVPPSGAFVWQIGDYTASKEWYEYALEESKEAGDFDGKSAALVHLGLLTWYMGDTSASFRYGGQAGELLAQIGKDPNSKAILRSSFLGETGAMWGELLAQDGDPAQAISFLQTRIGANETAAQGEATIRAIEVDSVFFADADNSTVHNVQALEPPNQYET